jgi:hypothetical protein
MSGSLLLEQRPTALAGPEGLDSLWAIKRARALESVLCAPNDLMSDFAFFADETALWAEASLPLADEAWTQD